MIRYQAALPNVPPRVARHRLGPLPAVPIEACPMSAVRTRAVQAFHGASAAAHATGDRRVEEILHQLAIEFGHRDTTDETLAGVMQALRRPTEEPTS